MAGYSYGDICFTNDGTRTGDLWKAWWHEDTRLKSIIITMVVLFPLAIILTWWYTRQRYKTQMANTDAAKVRDLEMMAARR